MDRQHSSSTTRMSAGFTDILTVRNSLMRFSIAIVRLMKLIF